MAFNLIVPPPKVKTGCFRISTVKLRGGPHKVQISIPSTMFTLLFKDAEKFDLLLGDGSDKGKLLIKPTTDGHFKPTFMKHAVLLRLPETEWTPQIDLSYDDPERREVQGGGLVVILPNWLAEEGKWKEIANARAQVAREREVQRKVIAK
jgi:hypothetical protein